MIASRECWGSRVYHCEAWFHALLQNVPFKSETHALWEQLFSDVTQFDDFRGFKAANGGIGADFRHKETGGALWCVLGMNRGSHDLHYGVCLSPQQ